jgi:hypothetical protein
MASKKTPEMSPFSPIKLAPTNWGSPWTHDGMSFWDMGKSFYNHMEACFGF